MKFQDSTFNRAKAALKPDCHLKKNEDVTVNGDSANIFGSIFGGSA